MRETKTVEFGGKKFRITELSAIDARRLFVQYGASFESGQYALNEELFRLLMRNVEVEAAPGLWARLETDELINQHVSSKILMKLEKAAVELSLGFTEAGGN